MVYRCTPYAHIRDIGQKIMAIQNPKFSIAYPPTSYPVDDRGEERKAEGVQIGADIIAGMKGCLVFDKAKRRTIPELLSGAFLCPAETGKDAIDENDLAVIVKRVAKMVANKRVPDEEADMLANVRSVPSLSIPWSADGSPHRNSCSSSAKRANRRFPFSRLARRTIHCHATTSPSLDPPTLHISPSLTLTLGRCPRFLRDPRRRWRGRTDTSRSV